MLLQTLDEVFAPPDILVLHLGKFWAFFGVRDCPKIDRLIYVSVQQGQVEEGMTRLSMLGPVYVYRLFYDDG